MKSYKGIQLIFLILFLLLLAVPCALTNFKAGTVSEDENRILAAPAKIKNEDGTLNKNFTADFENWFNDNVGLRSELVVVNAKIRYYGSRVISNNTDMFLGPNGELNYATPEMLRDFQHLNLLTDNELTHIAQCYQALNDYLKERDIQFYYFQCWDKHTIYPEYFPTTIQQFGKLSRTDQIMDAIKHNTNINLVNPKQTLLQAKENYEPYSFWGDPTHWTPRGAFVGYTELMQAINTNNQGKYKILTEEDYDIEIIDIGKTLFGGIHTVNMSEDFQIKNPQAVLSDEESAFLSSYSGLCKNIFYNEEAENQDTLLIFGDSYFDNFLYDDLAESFYKVVLIRDHLADFKEVVAYYDQQIVVIENAERADRTHLVLEVGDAMLQYLYRPVIHTPPCK